MSLLYVVYLKKNPIFTLIATLSKFQHNYFIRPKPYKIFPSTEAYKMFQIRADSIGGDPFAERKAYLLF